MRKVTFLASLGSSLEYFDFVIYGMFASFISQIFFPEAASSIVLLKIFGVFAVGYLARPIGGILFGSIADLHGRKNIFLSVVLLMSIATILIGLSPTYYSIGVLAPILLSIFRFLQGLSFGAELPGALTVISEFVDEKKVAKHSSFVISSTTIGSIIASAFLFLITKNLQNEQILSWGWRIPFLFGGGMGFIMFFLRKTLDETPKFTKIHFSKLSPIKELFTSHVKALIIASFAMILPSMLIIVNITYPAYLSVYYKIPIVQVYSTTTISLIYAVGTLPLFGWISDRYGKQLVFLLTSFMLILFSLFGFKALMSYNLLLFMIVNQTFICASMTSFFPFLTQLFPTSVRFVGVAVSYNLAYLISSMVPFLLFLGIYLTGNFQMIFYALAVGGGISFLAALSSLRLQKQK